MKKFLVPSIVLSTFAVSSAIAADLPRAPQKAPVAPPVIVYDWSGLYIGGHIGYGYAEADVTDRTILGGVTNLTSTQRIESEGFLGGVQAGWNYQIGRFVLGGEVDYSFADIKGDATATIAGVDVSRSSDVAWIATSTARFGYAWDRVMVYSKLGAAFAQFDYTNSLVQGGVSVLNATASETRVGFTVGTGIEWMIAGGWSAKAEYNYMDFGRKSVDFGAAADGTPINVDIDQRIQVIKAGVNYRFGPMRY